MADDQIRTTALPLLAGIGRDAENDRALVIYCTRRPTDDEMRAIHNAAKEATGFDWAEFQQLRRMSP